MDLQEKIGIAFVFILIRLFTFAQESESLQSLFKVDYDTPLTLALEAEKENDIEPIKGKKKKVKRNIFFGLKTRKGYTRTIFGKDVVYELFHTLKKYEAPLPYARNFYWVDHKKKKIMNSLHPPGDKNVRILHGPYKKMLGEQVLEKGWFYKGMKHRRWVRFNRHDILQNKAYWWKGWPQESRLAYYDFNKTKLKEVIPVHYGEMNGEYWAFHENGSIAVRGKYKFNHKVGLWKEYYDGRKVKREVLYPDDPFNFDFNPHISREWDREGILIYDRAKFYKE